MNKIKCPRCKKLREEVKQGKEDKDYYSNCYRCKGTNDVSKEKTQLTEFPKMTTDHLLSLRQSRRFYIPRFAGDKDLGYKSGSFLGYNLDHELLRSELSKRPHRIRARDRRLAKNK